MQRYGNPCKRTSLLLFLLLPAVLLLTACGKESFWPPEVQQVPDESPVLSPEEALESFYLPPGYDIELVASEPLVVDPVAMDFDADGRLWVVEMRSYMPTVDAEGEKEPVGKIAVLEDTTGDGQMDKRTVYMDELVLPRAVKVLEHGVLVGAPPNLWFTRDTTGNLKADVAEKIREDFGDPTVNPESNPNSLMWGMDNWIHTTRYEGRFRLTNNQLEYDETPSLGQWGISMDDYGRIYRNSNSNPLFVDYISPHYYMRNEDVRRQRGIYEAINKNRAVWPVRPTTGINRGYREHMLRDDSTLARYTSASALAVYRGDRLPDELRSNVFVPEPAGNLVQRLVVEKQEDGSLFGYNPYEDLETDFLTSTDERFRPVNMYSSPDGTLYIVDMYRGIIQHGQFLTNYLETEIKKRGLEKPVGLGRIYRVVHESGEPSDPPRLSSKSPEELVDYLDHPNGWWRNTVQRLLVERQADDVAVELRELVQSAEEDYTRLHALWTLDGLNAIDDQSLQSALSDPSPHLRAAAIRIAEPRFAGPDPTYTKTVMELVDDPTHIVRRQLAASAGEFPADSRDEAFLDIINRYGTDPMVVSLVISGLPDREFAFLEQLLDEASGREGTRLAAQEIAEVVLHSGSDADTQRLLDWIADSGKSDWQRESLLAALEEGAPESSPERVRLLELDQKPTVLLASANSDSEDRQIAERISEVIDRLGWPGKPRTEPESEPLTPDEKKRFERGKDLYSTSCATCHQQNGQGIEGMGVPLVDSKWVLGQASHLIRILLDGKEGDMRMPPAGHHSDEELAAIATYLRRAWGHEESPVTPSAVKEVRGASTGRDEPWTEEELNEHRH
ncbi:c-type cytochrome [Fodinibius sp.]|uniref:DUF7133 domain-containing protein n=1 Tax=Fodinibius sp. TaxID=1872440 RepID=UPI003568FC58